jgi:hypothetical protein
MGAVRSKKRGATLLAMTTTMIFQTDAHFLLSVGNGIGTKRSCARVEQVPHRALLERIVAWRTQFPQERVNCRIVQTPSSGALTTNSPPPLVKPVG